MQAPQQEGSSLSRGGRDSTCCSGTQGQDLGRRLNLQPPSDSQSPQQAVTQGVDRGRERQGHNFSSVEAIPISFSPNRRIKRSLVVPSPDHWNTTQSPQGS